MMPVPVMMVERNSKLSQLNRGRSHYPTLGKPTHPPTHLVEAVTLTNYYHAYTSCSQFHGDAMPDSDSTNPGYYANSKVGKKFKAGGYHSGRPELNVLQSRERLIRNFTRKQWHRFKCNRPLFTTNILESPIQSYLKRDAFTTRMLCQSCS